MKAGCPKRMLIIVPKGIIVAGNSCYLLFCSGNTWRKWMLWMPWSGPFCMIRKYRNLEKFCPERFWKPLTHLRHPNSALGYGMRIHPSRHFSNIWIITNATILAVVSLLTNSAIQSMLTNEIDSFRECQCRFSSFRWPEIHSRIPLHSHDHFTVPGTGGSHSSGIITTPGSCPRNGDA